MKRWITPKKQPTYNEPKYVPWIKGPIKFDHAPPKSVPHEWQPRITGSKVHFDYMPHNEFKTKHDMPLPYTREEILRKIGIDEWAEIKEENVGTVVRRIDLNKAQVKKYSDEWFETDTKLSFADWLYITKNVFSYEPNTTDVYNMLGTYKTLERKKENDVHFVQWLQDSGYDFYDTTSGRTVDEICRMYNAYHKTNQATSRIVMRGEIELSREERDKLRDEHNSYRKTTKDCLIYADWLLVEKKIVCYGHGQTRVSEYNESEYSDSNNSAFMVFPEYLKSQSHAVTRDSLGVDKLAKLCYDRWNIRKKNKETPKTEERHMACYVKPHFTFERMTLDQLDERIRGLEKEMETNGLSKVLQQRIAIAMKYRNRLAENAS